MRLRCQRKPVRGDADIGRFVHRALDGAKRAADLTQRLLAFSRQQPLEPKPLNVNRMVAGMRELLDRTLGETISVETVLSAGLWQVEADAAQLESSLLNLAVNARDAMQQAGQLTIETANAFVDDRYANEYALKPGQFVLIAVSDTGSGMEPDVVAKAFDPFYTTKGVGKGSGLGLSQVYGFVRQSGGNVKIYSEVGVGTSVKIYLPRNVGDPVPAGSQADNMTIEAGHAAEVIMVVEDDNRVRSMLVEALRELGYTVIDADRPWEAIRMFESGQQVDLLFTDVVMPEMSGRQLVDRLLTLKPDLKVLFTTGYTRNAIVHNGVLDSGTQLLTKPFTVDDLAAKVRSILDG